MPILVTGGAGFIGSHIVKALKNTPHAVLTLDNLSIGHRAAVTHGEFVQADLADKERLEQIFQQHSISAVIHLAGSIVVEESLGLPETYYQNNVVNSLNLMQACLRHGVRHFVFSSTAALYADPGADGVCREDSLIAPGTPYGKSKWMVEQMLFDCARAHDFKVVCLRYFNVAGADPAGEIGSATPQPSGLFPVITRVAMGRSPQFSIYGTDYPTPDGSGVRDYIHVADLAQAHLKAIEYLQNGGEAVALNCGYGRGHSVKEVLAEVERYMGHKLNVQLAPRRPGDLGKVISANGKILQTLGWQPRYQDLASMVAHSLQWEKNRRY